MNIKVAIAIILLVSLAACSDKKDQAPQSTPQDQITPTVEPMGKVMPEPVPDATREQKLKSVDEETATKDEEPASEAQEIKESVAGGNAGSGTEATVPSKTDTLDLADKSGCLACHSVEKKVVGPAWQDVGAKYKGDAGAKARLIDKVKKGGKGNWSEVTGGIPMPPYSPRVEDDTIEKLVTFILSLP
jgi:cytochrome c